MPRLEELKRRLDAPHPPEWEEAVLDVLQQVEGLTTPRFVLATDWPRLTEFPRLLAAALARLDLFGKPPGPVADGDRENRLAPHRARLVRRLEQCPNPSDPPGKVAAYRWLVEELRVSLWAPDLGKGVDVIERRLDKQWQRAKLA